MLCLHACVCLYTTCMPGGCPHRPEEACEIGVRKSHKLPDVCWEPNSSAGATSAPNHSGPVILFLGSLYLGSTERWTRSEGRQGTGNILHTPFLLCDEHGVLELLHARLALTTEPLSLRSPLVTVMSCRSLTPSRMEAVRSSVWSGWAQDIDTSVALCFWTHFLLLFF